MEESQQGEDHKPLEFKSRIDLGQLQTSSGTDKSGIGKSYHWATGNDRITDYFYPCQWAFLN